MFHSMLQGLQEIHPILFILALCFFPLGPIPVSPLWILAGLRFGPTAAILISFFCLLVNFAIAYMLSAVLMRGLIKKIILKHVKKMPNIQRSQQLSFTTIVRLVPGTPLAIQNYLLGFLRIKPLIYFMVSVPIQMLYAVGFIIPRVITNRGEGWSNHPIMLIINSDHPWNKNLLNKTQ